MSQFRGGSYLSNKGSLFGVALLFCLGMGAQSLSFQPPLSFDASSNPDCAGASWADPNLPDAYPTLIFGTTVHCVVPLAPGVYAGFLTMIEPNKKGPNQRLFTVSIQGQTSTRIDLFAAVGVDKVYTFPFIANVTSGTLDILLKASLGNAVLTHVDVTQQTPLYFVPGQRTYWTAFPAPTDTVDPFTHIVHDAVEYLDAADGKLKVLLKSGAVVVLTP